MSVNVTTEQKLNLTAAAINAVGPIVGDRSEWLKTVTNVLEEITRQSISGQFSDLIDKVASEKRLTGVLTAIRHDKQTNRAVVTIKVPNSKYSPDGEEISTDRLEDPDALALASHIKANLIGHRVTVWKQPESNARGNFVVLRKVEDRGPAVDSEAVA